MCSVYFSAYLVSTVNKTDNCKQSCLYLRMPRKHSLRKAMTQYPSTNRISAVCRSHNSSLSSQPSRQKLLEFMHRIVPAPIYTYTKYIILHHKHFSSQPSLQKLQEFMHRIVPAPIYIHHKQDITSVAFLLTAIPLENNRVHAMDDQDPAQSNKTYMEPE